MTDSQQTCCMPEAEGQAHVQEGMKKMSEELKKEDELSQVTKTLISLLFCAIFIAIIVPYVSKVKSFIYASAPVQRKAPR